MIRPESRENRGACRYAVRLLPLEDAGGPVTSVVGEDCEVERCVRLEMCTRARGECRSGCDGHKFNGIRCLSGRCNLEKGERKFWE